MNKTHLHITLKYANNVDNEDENNYKQDAFRYKFANIVHICSPDLTYCQISVQS